MPKVESGPRKISRRQRRSFGLKVFVAVVSVLWLVALYMVVIRFRYR